MVTSMNGLGAALNNKNGNGLIKYLKSEHQGSSNLGQEINPKLQ